MLALPLSRLIEELTLIRCSLLPGEHFTFLDSFSNLRDHSTLVAAVSEEEKDEIQKDMELLTARFRLAIDSAKVSFEIDCQRYDGECRSVNDCISITGDNLSRAMQERWRERVKEGLDGVEREEQYPLYQLLSLYLLPQLHESAKKDEDIGNNIREAEVERRQGPEEIYHVLFTSHHLISPSKRRNLQNWSSSLCIAGFAKVGYPGVIYAQGLKDDMEEFVGNVKAMQWLALKVRFVEPLESDHVGGEKGGDLIGWKEFEKVGEVVEEMRRVGRGKYVVEMGIGAGVRE
ncbi:RWD domain-containing protein 2B [Leucoagaricus sp. SymC.cos]|nr:RWD domain-containing protein 2B [Leucoagaricus sp. SymC.cos]